MDAVRGLCSSSLVSGGVSTSSQGEASTSQYSSSSRLSSSSSRRGNNVHINAAAPVRRISRKSRRLVLFAVLADTQVQTQGVAVSSKSTLKLEESHAAVSTLLPDLDNDSTDLQTELPNRLPNAASNVASNAASNVPVSRRKLPVLGLTDTDLKSTLEHRLWTSFFATTATATLAKAFSVCHGEAEFLQLTAGILSAWALSDLATGIYHWGIDNYGSASTPILGPQIDAFQGHHRRPWTITKREFANNVHAIARPASLVLVPCLFLPSHALADAFLAVFMALVVLSQHTHALAHMKKSQLPGWVAGLQDRGLILGRKTHGTHHRAPYDVNYCIVSGVWNDVLNEVDLFKRMERLVFARFGVAPRAWGEMQAEWVQADTYFEDGSEFDPSQSS